MTDEKLKSDNDHTKSYIVSSQCHCVSSLFHKAEL